MPGAMAARVAMSARLVRPIAVIVALALAIVGLLGSWPDVARADVARSGGGEVSVARLRGEIGPAAARYINRVAGEAEKRSVEALVVVVDTPGGLDVSMRAIVQRLLGSEVPVIAWVGPAGARAASAGTFIVMAADVAAMAPGTTIGAAHPIMVSGGSVMPVDPVLMDKVTNDAAGYLRGLAAQRGRNAEWADRAVRESAVLGAAEAMRERAIDVVAPSVEDLMAQLDGRRVAGPWGTRPLRFGGATVVEAGETIAEMIVAVVGQPAVAYVLCLVGLVLIGAELFTTTGGAIGVAGSICLVLALVGFDSLPVRSAGVALLALGIALLVAEVKAGGHGLLATGAVVAVAIGSWWLFPDAGPTIAGVPARPSAWVTVTAVGTVAAIAVLMLMTGATAAWRPVVPVVPVIGEVGHAETALLPAGTVHLRGEAWSGRAIAGTMPAGARVRVAGRDGLTLLVEPAEVETRPGDARA